MAYGFQNKFYNKTEMVKVFKSILSETEKAVKVNNDNQDPVWLPKSKIEIQGLFVVGIEEWLLKDKNIKGKGLEAKKATEDFEEYEENPLQDVDKEKNSTQEEENKGMESKKFSFKLVKQEESKQNSDYAIVITNKKNGKSYKRNAYNSKKGKYFFFHKNAYRIIQDYEGNITLKNLGPYYTAADDEDEEFKPVENKEFKPFVKKAVEFGKHAKHETIKELVKKDLPVYLYGPAGSGKNYTIQEIAEELNLDFYFTNSVQEIYRVTGFIDAGGKFHETEFFKAFKNGGLFFLDELDASIPDVLILLNAAIANRYFEFPTGRIDAHEDFRVIAAGNTAGNGADEQYTGRLALDASSLDRFTYVKFDYDRNVEMSIADGNKELVDFIEDVRAIALNTGIRSTFSYRAIINVKKLEGVLELTEVLLVGVFKGMDKDTMNTIYIKDWQNKYWKAFDQLKKAM